MGDAFKSETKAFPTPESNPGRGGESAKSCPLDHVRFYDPRFSMNYNLFQCLIFCSIDGSAAELSMECV